MHRLGNWRFNTVLLAGLVPISLWPALLNGYPFFSTDTPAYFRYVDVGVAHMTGRQSEWANPALLAGPRKSSQAPHEAPSSFSVAASATDPATRMDSITVPDQSTEPKAPFAGRSVYYGALLEFGHISGSLWVSVVIQSLALLITIAMALYLAGGLTRLTFVTLVLGLCLTTPVAFFTSFLMPDLFAGIAILCSASILAFGATMPLWMWPLWLTLLSLGLLFHSSHIVTALIILCLSLLLRCVMRIPLSTKGMVVLGAGIVIGLMGELAYSAVTARMIGVRPIRPPFLTARLIEDGPGTRYLQVHCNTAAFSACQFRDRLSSITAADFLWSPEPTRGVFTPADPETRRALSEEQYRFVFAVVRDDPVGVALAALRNTAIQSVMLRLKEFNLNDNDRSGLSRDLPRNYLQRVQLTKGWSDLLPTTLLSAVVLITLVGSVVYLGIRFVVQPRSANESRFGPFSMILVAGVTVNAFVCGAMSDPYDRYQIRVIWLIPLLAGFSAGIAWKRRLTVSGGKNAQRVGDFASAQQ